MHLVTEVDVPACKEKRDTKGPQATVLRVRLLVVASLLHQLLHLCGLRGEKVGSALKIRFEISKLYSLIMVWAYRHRLLVSEDIALCRDTRLLDEDVGIRSQSSHYCDDMVIDFVHLLGCLGGSKQGRRLVLLTSQHNTICRENTDGCACIIDSFNSVFYLVKAAVRGERGC